MSAASAALRTLSTTCCVAGGGPAGMMLGYPAGARRRRRDRAREARRLPARFPRRHHPSLDARRSCTSSACSRVAASCRTTRSTKLTGQVGGTPLTHRRFLLAAARARRSSRSCRSGTSSISSPSEAERYPSFHLLMEANVDRSDRRERPRRRRACDARRTGRSTCARDLVVGCDGRHSTVRANARPRGRGHRRAHRRAVDAHLAHAGRSGDRRPHRCRAASS